MLCLQLPIRSRVDLNVALVVADKGQSSPRDMELMKPLLQMVFHCIDKMKRFNLGKEVICSYGEFIAYIWH